MKIALEFASSVGLDCLLCAATLAGARLWWARVGERRFLARYQAPGGSQSHEEANGT